jgi:hypothetical protein
LELCITISMINHWLAAFHIYIHIYLKNWSIFTVIPKSRLSKFASVSCEENPLDRKCWGKALRTACTIKHDADSIVHMYLFVGLFEWYAEKYRFKSRKTEVSHVDGPVYCFVVLTFEKQSWKLINLFTKCNSHTTVAKVFETKHYEYPEDNNIWINVFINFNCMKEEAVAVAYHPVVYVLSVTADIQYGCLLIPPLK